MAAIIAIGFFYGNAMADKNDPGKGQASQASIGSAKMLADGTIVMMLRAESDSGVVGGGFFRYPPDHPKYNAILRHLGGLKKGEEKPVPPWPAN